ncbi:MAG: hypothetical protein ABJE66_15470 [Deltaproteobacteria bacterium]
MRLFVLAFMVGCSTSTQDPVESLGDVNYTPPPSTWSHHDTKEIGRLVSRWRPDENPNKESISIIRATVQGRSRGASPDQLEAMLVQAQHALPSPSVQSPTVGKTKRSLPEVEIASDFVPVGLKDSYHRVHAMILDGEVVVHVLYTARTPDPSLAMFRQVVDSIRRGEG